MLFMLSACLRAPSAASAHGWETGLIPGLNPRVEPSLRIGGSLECQPACFKWAAMAAIASHHIRLALFPLRLDADRTGFVDFPHSLAGNCC
jgi:hypothetical protein